MPGNAGVNLTISGLEISGAARPGANPNGAGVSPIGGMNVTISHSEVSNNGAPIGSAYAAAGQDHNIYAGSLTSLTVSNSYIHSVFS